jgi:hypothetical protein
MDIRRTYPIALQQNNTKPRIVFLTILLALHYNAFRSIFSVLWPCCLARLLYPYVRCVPRQRSMWTPATIRMRDNGSDSPTEILRRGVAKGKTHTRKDIRDRA